MAHASAFFIFFGSPSQTHNSDPRQGGLPTFRQFIIANLQAFEAS
jgi:hypothetical protein